MSDKEPGLAIEIEGIREFSMPETIFVDKNGNIVDHKRGPMDISLIISAFIAGILTFLAPCTLPLVPGYLSFISGASLEDLKDPEKAKRARGKIFLNGLFFMFGFSAVFIIMGTLVGFIGATLLAPYRLWLGRIGGIFVIVFRLFMLHPHTNPFIRAIFDIAFFPIKNFLQKMRALFGVGVNILKIPFLMQEKQLKAPILLKRGKPTSSFILGSAFAFGWTPLDGLLR